MPSATGWSATADATSRPLHDAQAVRSAGPELLSLALIDSRNRLLQLLALEESPFALRDAAVVGRLQEDTITCHLQRGRGEHCDARSPRLAGIEPRVDDWINGAYRPSADQVRAYLQETLEATLDLLAALPPHAGDDALYFYRHALRTEDACCEKLAERLHPGLPPARARRDPLWLPAQRLQLGSPRGGYVPLGERWAHEVRVPESEIDAQVVDWAAFAEFADDGGYDREELWSPAGWAWRQRSERQAPLHVEQLRRGVVLRLGGRLLRAAAAQPVLHASRFEAEAWVKWAGRRLPTEAEWELAACTAVSRGFVWGDVFEWVAGRARAWPGADDAGPGIPEALPSPERDGVLRGASFATPRRAVHPKARRFARPEQDTMFCGFRSCAI